MRAADPGRGAERLFGSHRTGDMHMSLTSTRDLIVGFDRGLRTVFAPARVRRAPVPGDELPRRRAGATEARHAAALMRVNHTGEICAQALYQGQALTARSSGAQAALERAAQEETEHLAWTESAHRGAGRAQERPESAVVRRIVRDRRGGGLAGRPLEPRFPRRNRASGRRASRRASAQAARARPEKPRDHRARCGWTKRGTRRRRWSTAQPSCPRRRGRCALRRA